MHTTTKRPLAALLTGFLLLALATVSLQSPTHAAAVPHPGASKLSGSFGGRMINPATGNPVTGVTVKVFEINTDNLLGQDKSGSAGYYRIDGLPAADEELDVRINGSAVRYETGWVGCHHNVVPSWGSACSFPQGRQSAIKVQHL